MVSTYLYVTSMLYTLNSRAAMRDSKQSHAYLSSMLFSENDSQATAVDVSR